VQGTHRATLCAGSPNQREPANERPMLSRFEQVPRVNPASFRALPCATFDHGTTECHSGNRAGCDYVWRSDPSGHPRIGHYHG
jgi:hypothetical protein